MTFIKIPDSRYGSRWVTPERLASVQCWCDWTRSHRESHDAYAASEGYPAHAAFSSWDDAIIRHGDDGEYAHLFPGDEQPDLLDRIDAALAEAERQRPDWHPEVEDFEGYVTWGGSSEAMAVRFGSGRTSVGGRQRRLGFHQHALLQFVMANPFCSQNSAVEGGYYSYKGSGHLSIHTLERRGLLTIDRSNQYRYLLTITEAGIEALASSG